MDGLVHEHRIIRKATLRLVPFPVRLLHHGVPRPRQRGVRRAADAVGSALQRHGLLVRRRHLLHRLLLLRGAEQRHPREGRGTAVDRPHHDPLGAHLLQHDVRPDARGLLRAPLSAGRWRGGVLPRDHPLPDVLVSVRVPFAHRRAVHDSRGDFRRDRRADIRTPARPSAVRPAGVAMAVPGRGYPRHPLRDRGARVPAERATRGAVAHERRTRLAGGTDRRGTRTNASV